MAMGKSRPGTSFGRFPGDRFTTILRSGHSKPESLDRWADAIPGIQHGRAWQAGQRK
jgi:hypothetical protein